MQQPIGPMALINQYNALLPSDRRRMRSVRSVQNRAHVESAVKFLAWCAENDVRDPLLYVRTRMKLAKHLVQFDQLATDTLVEAYRERSVMKNHAAKMRAANPPERIYLRSLMVNARAHEIVRRDYVAMNQTHLCLVQPELSGGYHPASPNCGSCAQAVPCAQRLNAREGIDVVALRAKRWDLLPHEVVAQVRDPEVETAQPISAAVPR